MAIRNYVGARYVPKFANPVEWQANTSYEAMVIVTYNNSSYTSKIPVPPTVGNPAENSTYWALTGNYNAQVEEYRQESTKAKDGICLVDERNNVAAAYAHRPHEYFWWKGKLYRAMQNLDVGTPLTVDRNIKEETVATGVYINTVEIAKTNNTLNLYGDNVDTNSRNIAKLQADVRSNTDDITSIKEKSMELDRDIGHLREDISTNGSNIATHSAEIANLKMNVSNNTNAISRLVANYIQYKVYTTHKHRYATAFSSDNITIRFTQNATNFFVEPIPEDTILIPISARYLYYPTGDEYNNPDNKGQRLLKSTYRIEPRETIGAKTFYDIQVMNPKAWSAVGDYWMFGVLEIKHL